MRPNSSRSIDFTDPDAALDELYYLVIRDGVSYCIVIPHEIRLRHKWRVVRSDKLINKQRICAEMAPFNIRSTNNGNHRNAPDHDDPSANDETRVAS